jgi:hypothetical protein
MPFAIGPEVAEPKNDPHPNDRMLEGATGGRDENGIITHTISWVASDITEVLTVGKKVGKTPDGKASYFGLAETNRTWTATNDDTGSYIVTVTYKGYFEDDEPVPEDTEQWSMVFDYSEEPIETHPFWAKIKTAYYAKPNAGDGSAHGYHFDEKLPKGAKKVKGLGGKLVGADGDRNPMYKVLTYAVLQARITRSFSTKKIERKWLDDVGHVTREIKELEASKGGAERMKEITPKDRDWLTQPPKITQQGGVFRVEQEWLLSPPGGWPEEVYELIQN